MPFCIYDMSDMLNATNFKLRPGERYRVFYVSIYFIAYSIRNKLFYINFNVLVFQSG